VACSNAKASEISFRPVVKFKDGKELMATVIGVEPRFDLAMLKVDAKGLASVEWADSKSDPVGNWVASAGQGETPVAVGVVSVASRTLPAREITRPVIIANSGYLGIGLDPHKDGPRITNVQPDSAASKAGLKVDDHLLSINGKRMDDPDSVIATLSHSKPGDVVTLKIKRGDEEMEVKAKLDKRPQDRGDEVLPGFVIEGQRRDERQIAPMIIEPVEEGELLPAVGLVFGDIKIDGNQPDTAPSATMPRDHGIGERVTHPQQHPGGGRVLEARNRRLRRQPAAVDRIAPQQQFVDRIVGEPVGVIAVRMATGDRVDALREQIADAVRHPRRRARIRNRRGQCGQQAELAIGRLEQDRAPVGTRVGLIKRRDQGPIEEVGKQNSLCYRVVVQRNRLRVGKRRLSTA